MLIGNSKNIWLPFLEACKCDPDLLAQTNPLDTYVERTVAAALQVSAQGYVSIQQATRNLLYTFCKASFALLKL